MSKEHLNRIGCVGCDDVFTLEGELTEELVHQLLCLRCGEQTLHRFPIFGSWPSDYERLPCETE